MHERNAAADLVRSAGIVAVQEGATRVKSMRVQIGGACYFDAESLAAQVTWHAQGTIVEGAEVIVEQRVMPEGAVPTRDDDRIMLLSVDLEE